MENFDLIRQWAKEKGIYKSGDPKTQYVKLQEEAGELAKAILKNDEPEILDALGDYYRQPIEMQWGVVQAFGDSVGYLLGVNEFGKGDVFSPYYDGNLFESRPEAQQEAITQFEKWYNENK